MLAIRLPRDELSVPVIRHLVGDALRHIGVLDEVRTDIELALTEACTNVLDHAGPGDSYDVTVTIRPDRCELRIIDIGHGFDHSSFVESASSDLDMTAERGRGLGLMHSLVDHIELVSEPEEGTLVRLVKQLAFDEDVAARRLLFRALHPEADEPASS
jgi:serine/threonine-protein kinase RsbW